MTLFFNCILQDVMTSNEVVEFIRERVADAMEPEEVSWWHL